LLEELAGWRWGGGIEFEEQGGVWRGGVLEAVGGENRCGVVLGWGVVVFGAGGRWGGDIWKMTASWKVGRKREAGRVKM